MNDPYKILGVSPDATDDEVKKAYRNLARKYHPDKYRDSDLADLASEKMKEINTAYEEIKNMREKDTSSGGAGAYGYGGNPYGAYGGSYSHSGSSRYNQIRTLLSNNNYVQAETLLNNVPEADRNAEWHFLMGCVCVKKKNFVDAQRYFDIACSMDPYNKEYRNAQEYLRSRANSYGGGNRSSSSDECSFRFCPCCCLTPFCFC